MLTELQRKSSIYNNPIKILHSRNTKADIETGNIIEYDIHHTKSTRL